MALAVWKDLCVDACDPAGVAAFWGRALGLAVERLADGDVVLRGSSPERTVWVNRVPEPRTAKNRVRRPAPEDGQEPLHWDVVVHDLPALLAAGVHVRAEPRGEALWHVLADPAGNEFCAFAP